MCFDIYGIFCSTIILKLNNYGNYSLQWTFFTDCDLISIVNLAHKKRLMYNSIKIIFIIIFIHHFRSLPNYDD